MTYEKTRAARWLGAGCLGVALILSPVGPAGAVTPVQKVKSAGGLEAWLMESHDIGIISMRFTFKGGALAEPADRPGVAQFTGYMFNEGAGDLDTEALSRQRQKLGVGFGGSADYTGLTISFSAPSLNKAEAFALLRRAMTEPRYDADPIERARREYEAALTAERTAPGSIAGKWLRERYFAGTRLALSTYGTLDTLKTIGAADIADFRKRTFARGNLKIAIAGDITAAEVGILIDDLFAGLPANADIAAEPPLPAQTAASDVVRMEIPQSLVMTGNAAPRLSWRQNLAFGLGKHVLSGDSAGRLFREVREKRGLVYGIGASQYDVAGASVFVTAFGAGSENVRPALDEARLQIAEFVEKGPSEDELATARQSFVGSFFLSLDTNEKIVNTLNWMMRENLPSDLLETYTTVVEGISVEDAREAARATIKPELMSTVVVGTLPAGVTLDGKATASAAQ